MKFDIQIPKDAESIINRLNEHGYEAYVVGGCVRDSILGRTPNDWDICTSATPDKVMEIFADQEVIPTGLQHGTVTVVINHTPYECTTFRIDGDYSDSRRPDKVEFTTDIVKDLSRRDFTINAMAYNPKMGLVDPFGGAEDIRAKIIRCVGDAKDRFTEDALRILRAVRFAAQLDFCIDSSTDNAIELLHKNLENISIERITSELNKMIVCPSFYRQMLCREFLFTSIIPELKECVSYNQYNPYHAYDLYMHIAFAVRFGNRDIVTELALLLHDIGKPRCQVFDELGVAHYYEHAKISATLADERLKAMKYDNDTRKKVVELISYHDATFDDVPKHIKKWLNKIGEEQFRRLLEVRYADIFAQNAMSMSQRLSYIDRIRERLDEVLASEQCFQLKDLAVNGNDLMKIGIPKGKEIGNTLKWLLDMVINEEAQNDKNELLNLVRSRMESV
jgi:tRNA nucleotidyltransferase (CCA-adding enzyme)